MFVEKDLCFYTAVNINIVLQIISGSRWKCWDGSCTDREVEQFIVSMSQDVWCQWNVAVLVAVRDNHVGRL